MRTSCASGSGSMVVSASRNMTHFDRATAAPRFLAPGWVVGRGCWMALLVVLLVVLMLVPVVG